MICPKCQNEVEQTFQTDIGTMCRDCAFTAAAYVPPEFDKLMAGLAAVTPTIPKATVKETFDSLKPYFNECLITPENGGMVALTTSIATYCGQTVCLMRARYVRELPPEELENPTQAKLEELIALAKSMPSVEFHLQ